MNQIYLLLLGAIAPLAIQGFYRKAHDALVARDRKGRSARGRRRNEMRDIQRALVMTEDRRREETFKIDINALKSIFYFQERWGDAWHDPSAVALLSDEENEKLQSDKHKAVALRRGLFSIGMQAHIDRRPLENRLDELRSETQLGRIRLGASVRSRSLGRWTRRAWKWVHGLGEQ